MKLLIITRQDCELIQAGQGRSVADLRASGESLFLLLVGGIGVVLCVLAAIGIGGIVL